MGRARKEITWQKMKELLLAITNDKGIVIEEARDFAKELKIPNYSKLSYMLKCKDKIFNGRSEPHINEKSKEFCKKYNEFDFQNAKSSRGYKKKLKQVQAELQFDKPKPNNNKTNVNEDAGYKYSVNLWVESQQFLIDELHLKRDYTIKNIDILVKSLNNTNESIQHEEAQLISYKNKNNV